jgi:SAM-dependent methyltransferase
MMGDAEAAGQEARQKLVVNVGCGPSLVLTRSPLFHDWRQLRVDIEESVQPDVIADLTDLSPIEAGTADALWSSHCLEHLYQHQVPGAIGEFHRVLAADGFAVILVPDLQAVAERIVADKFIDPVYESPAGPVTTHDMFYGFGPAIAGGQTSMAHRCGFTPSVLVAVLDASAFVEYAIRRLPSLELLVVARKTPGEQENNCEALLGALDL